MIMIFLVINIKIGMNIFFFFYWRLVIIIVVVIYILFIVIFKNNNQVILDEDGDTVYVSPTSYTILPLTYNRLLAFSLAKAKLGVIDLNDNTIIDFEYDYIFTDNTYTSNFFSVQKDDKYGAFDLDGNIIFEPSSKYKEIIHGDGNYLYVRNYASMEYLYLLSYVELFNATIDYDTVKNDETRVFWKLRLESLRPRIRRTA